MEVDSFFLSPLTRQLIPALSLPYELFLMGNSLTRKFLESYRISLQ
jgi:hypothetical protein